MVPRAEQCSELGTDAYSAASLRAPLPVDPARCQGLLDRAGRQAQVVPRRAVKISATAFFRDDGAGMTTARDVVIAPNGYANSDAWLRRRVIPIGSYMIAIEPQFADVMARPAPKRRIVSDTRGRVHTTAVAGRTPDPSAGACRTTTDLLKAPRCSIAISSRSSPSSCKRASRTHGAVSSRTRSTN
jgi:hypothetical protein